MKISPAVPLALFLLCSSLAARAQTQKPADTTWPQYGKDLAGTRFSPATQIAKSNVTQLKAACETTPILVEGKLFLTTPYDHVIALNPATGEKIWEFDPYVDLSKNYSEVTNRGVSAWRDLPAKSDQPCALRIFFGTLDARLVALDGETGKPC